MAEAIQDNPKEAKLFQNQIPKMARVLIPVWKGRFYDPRTECLRNATLNPMLE